MAKVIEHNVTPDDLSETRRENYYNTLRRLGKSEEWGLTALTINSLDNWERWGFGSFEQGWVDRIVIQKMREKRLVENDDYIKKIDTLEKQVAALTERVIQLELLGGIK